MKRGPDTCSGGMTRLPPRLLHLLNARPAALGSTAHPRGRLGSLGFLPLLPLIELWRPLQRPHRRRARAWRLTWGQKPVSNGVQRVQAWQAMWHPAPLPCERRALRLDFRRWYSWQRQNWLSCMLDHYREIRDARTRGWQSQFNYNVSLNRCLTLESGVCYTVSRMPRNSV